MTAMEKMRALLEELESSGQIESYAECPGVPRFDIFLTRPWEYDEAANSIQIEVIP